MSFFDAQPAGRLLNRFSRDTEAADILLRENVAYWIYEVCASPPAVILVALCCCQGQGRSLA